MFQKNSCDEIVNKSNREYIVIERGSCKKSR